MRPLRVLTAIVFLAVGVALGALNPTLSTLDLGIVRVQAGLGVLLIATLLCGVLLGGLAIVLSLVLPLRRALARAKADPASVVSTALPASSPSSSSEP